MKRKWNSQFDDFLKENINRLSKDQIAITLGVKPSAVDSARVRLGLSTFNKWPSEDDRILLERAPHLTISGLASLLNRSEASVKKRVEQLGATPKPTPQIEKYSLTTEQKEFIISNRLTLSRKQIQKALGISRNHLIASLASHKIKIRRNAPYTDIDDSFLMENYITLGAKKCAEHLERTVSSISSRALTLNIRTGRNRKWSIEEDRFLAENINKISPEQVGLNLRRSLSAVKQRMRLVGANQRLTREEVRFIEENYITHGAEWVSRKLNVSPERLIRKAKRLGFHSVSRQLQDRDLQFISENYSTYGPHWIAERLSCTKQTAIEAAKKIGVSYTRARWTPEDDQFLLDNYRKRPIIELAELLFRTYKAIPTRHKKLTDKQIN